MALAWALFLQAAVPVAAAAAAAVELGGGGGGKQVADQEVAGGVGQWLPEVQLEDYECRGRAEEPSVVDWGELRKGFQVLTDHALDGFSLRFLPEDAVGAAIRRGTQVDLLGRSAVVLLRFQTALSECPLGTAVASLFLSCMAHLPREDVFDEELPAAHAAVLEDVANRPFLGLLEKDLRLLLAIAPVHVVAATEWNVFKLLTMYVDRVVPLSASPLAVGPVVDPCAGTGIHGYTSQQLRGLLLKYVPYASGKDIQGIKFLKGLDSTVLAVMKDPMEFVTSYIHACPAGAAAFASAAVMLSLMTNPAIVDHMARVETLILQAHLEAVVAGASQWGVFHAFAKQGTFATRPLDLVWSMRELLPLPADPAAFDAIRLEPEARRARLARAAAAHPHGPTRRLSGFLASLEEHGGDRPERIVYLTAVGGKPFSDHIGAFVRRAAIVGLPALVIVCMDQEAQGRCEAAAEGARAVCCVPALEGHVVLVKHAFIPVLLSAGVDTVWIDFDTFIVQDPTPALVEARDSPDRVLLATRPRIRYGTFLFENASDMCSISRVCDKRQQWPFSVEDKSGLEEPTQVGAEMLVTEHWDARCLNNGLFYVRATHRPLVFFTLFLAQLYSNPYIDNQNLLDAYLVHSSFDAAAPEARPLLHYASLDIGRKFACAEGYMGDPREVVTFHFWSSDFRTREASDEEVGEVAEAEESRIRLRNGVERVPKPTATKAELFELFFGGDVGQVTDGLHVPAAAASFFRRVRAPAPLWRGLCSTTGVGVEDLVDERLLQGNESMVDWSKATAVHGDVIAEPSSYSASCTVGGSQACVLLGSTDAGLKGPEAALKAQQLEGNYLHGRQYAPAGADASSGPRCAGAPKTAWVEALRRAADFEDAALLDTLDAAHLKARLRRLDAGCLWAVLGIDVAAARERLAIDVEGLLAECGTRSAR